MKLLFIFLFLTFNLLAVTRIMPLGDSITYDNYHSDEPSLGGTPRPASQRHAYRNYLWYKLTDAGFNVDFVGSRNAGSAIRPPFDPDNEGWPGEKSKKISEKVYSFLEHNQADIILLHIGSNDWSENVTYVDVILDEIDRYESDYHHHIKVILAKIINRSEYEPIRHQFNINLQHLANTRIHNGDDIYVVDMEYGAGLYYDSRDFKELTHPNNSGYEKMARVWYKALKRFLTSGSSIPKKPTNFVATSLTDHSALIKWTDNANNETVLKINHGDTPVARLGSDSTQYKITGLAAGHTYTYSLRACNDSGCSEIQYVTFTTEITIPPKPTNFITSTITANSITLQWDDTSDNETLFKINDGDTPLARPSSNSTNYTISGLEPRKTYTFTLRACNDNGCSAVQNITFTTKDDYGWVPAVYHAILY